MAGTSRTDAESELQDALVHRAAARNRRIQAVAAASLAAAVVLVGTSSLQADPDPGPRAPQVPPGRSTGPMNADEQLAHDFASAWFSYDRSLATSYVASRATSSRPSSGRDGRWRRNRLDEALGSAFRVDGCYEIGSPSSSSARVGCLYTVDLLGLGDLGRGPFRGNLFLVAVEDGKVVDFFTALGANDYDEVGWGPFVEWVEKRGGRDVPDVDGLEEPSTTAAEVGRTIRFWQRAGRDYVAALRSGEVT